MKPGGGDTPYVNDSSLPVFRRFSLDIGNKFRNHQFCLVIIVLMDSFAIHLCIIINFA